MVDNFKIIRSMLKFENPGPQSKSMTTLSMSRPCKASICSGRRTRTVMLMRRGVARFSVAIAALSLVDLLATLTMLCRNARPLSAEGASSFHCKRFSSNACTASWRSVRKTLPGRNAFDGILISSLSRT